MIDFDDIKRHTQKNLQKILARLSKKYKINDLRGNDSKKYKPPTHTLSTKNPEDILMDKIKTELQNAGFNVHEIPLQQPKINPHINKTQQITQDDITNLIIDINNSKSTDDLIRVM